MIGGKKRIGRLLIVDQWLRDLVGHHAEYDFAVGNAARRRGLEVVLLANTRCEISTEAEFTVLPTFTSGRGDPYRPDNAQVYNVAASTPAWPFLADLKFGLDKLQADERDQAFIHSIEFNELEDLLALCITRDLARIPFLHILVRRDPVEIAGTPRLEKMRRLIRHFRSLDLIGRKVAFYTDTDALSQVLGALTDVEFTTLPVPFQAERIVGRSDSPKISLVYLGDARSEKGYTILPSIVHNIYADNKIRNRVKFTIQSNPNIPGGEMGVIAARNQLEAFPESLCDIRRDALKTEEYYEILSNADIVLLPYDVDRYRLRSSGVFYQALAAGKVVVVPDGTQMASILASGEGVIASSELSFVQAVRQAVDQFDSLSRRAEERRGFWNETCSADKLVGMLCDFHKRRTSAPPPPPLALIICEALPFWERSGCGHIFDRQVKYLTRAGYRVAMIGIVGAHLSSTHETMNACERFNQALTDHGLDIGYAWISSLPSTRHEEWNTLSGELSRSDFLGVPESLRDFLASNAVSFVLCNYITRLPFVQKLGLSGVPVICETHDIQAFQFALGRGGEVDPKELEREFALLAQVDGLISISRIETDRIVERLPHIPIRTIPPVRDVVLPTTGDLAGPKSMPELVSSAGSKLDFVDFNRAWHTNSLDQMLKLFNEDAIDILFVGADTIPNYRAFKWFVEEVYDKYLTNKANVLVAGSIVNKRDALDRDRIYWSGPVDTLRPYYAATKIVLLPITDGAGSNIKVLEALAHGKPVVATTFALRDFSDLSEIRGVDTPRAFATEIEALLDNPSRRQAFSRVARGTAMRAHRQYDPDVLMDELLSQVLNVESSIRRDDRTEFASVHVEWNEDIKLINVGISDYLERSADLPSTVYRWIDEIERGDGFDIVLIEILDAIFCRKTAPILADGPARFRQITRTKSSVTASDALHRIFAAAATDAYFDRTSSNFHQGQSVGTGARTLLQIKRGGAPSGAEDAIGKAFREVLGDDYRSKSLDNPFDDERSQAGEENAAKLVLLGWDGHLCDAATMFAALEALSFGRPVLLTQSICDAVGLESYCGPLGQTASADLKEIASKQGLVLIEAAQVRPAFDHMVRSLDIAEQLQKADARARRVEAEAAE